MAKDFTSINFGWIGYWAPSRETIGTQPDMIEYATSRAAAWDCPISLVGDLPQLKAHLRTPDNLEVIRRWEDVRASGWLTSRQKSELQNLEQEHILLIDENGAFELAPYTQIEAAAGKDSLARAFVFERKAKVYVIFWHSSGSASLEIPLPSEGVRLLADIGKPLQLVKADGALRVPLEGRMYLECSGLSRERVIAAFHAAKVHL